MQEKTPHTKPKKQVREEEQQPLVLEQNHATEAESQSTTEAVQTDEFFERVDFIADPKQSQVRVDKFIYERMAGKSRNKVQNAIKAGSVTVDDKEVKSNYKVKPGNRISIILPQVMEEGYEVLPQQIKINIVYEDDDVLIIDKHAGIAVHPGVGIPKGTIVNAVSWHLKEKAKDLPVLGNNEPTRAGIVHRIDKDTTGLMVVAKNEFAMTHLANQFFYHTIERRYQAIVWGSPDADSGTIVANIGRNPNDRRMFMTFPEGDEGKHAVTHWRVIERFYYASLVEFKLETGRTHQIRVHAKSIGHTLFGDVRYGGNQILKGTIYAKYKQFVENLLSGCQRQALHAKVIGFTHPRSGEFIRFESELPDDMAHVIEKWRSYHDSRKQLV
jgi:23S rRNA pseudouridine1911/1915/1917 synthase